MRDKHREAWTAFIEGREAVTGPKYGNKRVLFDGTWFASQREANVAAKLRPLSRSGAIKDYTEQKRITLVPGDGKLRPVIYIADFYYVDADGPHVLDAKGFKTPVYRLKKRLAALLLRITIEEV